jgi:transcriptional regulator with XRE-family HTH domain
VSKINSNLLALRRKRLAYEQKQIALLLGHQTKHQLSRYETGQRTPSLKEALKLSMLYGLPIRTLFSRYYRECREELENVLKNSNLETKINLENAETVDYCSYREAMSPCIINSEVSDTVRRHIKILMEELTEKSVDT